MGSDGPQPGDSLIDFLAGVVGGCAGSLVGQPLDFLKVRVQLSSDHSRGAIACLRESIKQDGVLSIYRGAVSPLVGVGFINATLFGTYGFFTSHIARDPKALTASEAFLCGTLAGIFGGAVASPFELVKIAQQKKTGARMSNAHVASALYRQQGVAVFGRGALITIVRDSPTYGLYFATYDTLVHRLSAWSGMPLLSILLAGALAGCMCWCTAYPFDVVKSHIQGDLFSYSANGTLAILPRSHERGVAAIARDLYRAGGVRKFYKGLSPCLLRAFPANAAVFFCYELAKSRLEAARDLLL